MNNIIFMPREFLSTLSLRRATHIRSIRQGTASNFYPRSPCGERRWLRCWQLAARDISIHALLAESDSQQPDETTRTTYFYPRSPCGERLHYDNYNLHCVEISIHALLAESDASQTNLPSKISDFYPRSPCGERPTKSDQGASNRTFLSTLSLRRATRW